MLTIDLFKSSFEESLLEGKVDQYEAVDNEYQTPSNLKQFSTPENWGVVSGKWAEIQDAVRLNVPYVTLTWPNGAIVTLTRNQLYTIYQKAVKLTKPKRTAWGLTTLNDSKNLLYYISNLKIIPRPAVKRPPADPAQGELPLDDLKEKKSSELSVDSPFKDVRVQRAIKKATFDNPAAASPEEAFIKSMLDAQDKDQEDIAKLRQSTEKQKELLSKNISKDDEQQNIITNISSEIDKVERENSALQRMQQGLMAANARLQQTLDNMRGRKNGQETPTVGVSVATDKLPAVDNTADIQALQAELGNLQQELTKSQNQDDVDNLKNQIATLKAQLADKGVLGAAQGSLGLEVPKQAPKTTAKKTAAKPKQPKAPAITKIQPPRTGLDIDLDVDDELVIPKPRKSRGAAGGAKIHEHGGGIRPKQHWQDMMEQPVKNIRESGMETWTVHFTDGTRVRVRVSDETDPAMVRKHYAKKGKTVAKFDYGYGAEPEAGPGSEAHEPGSGRAVSARTGDPLPEDAKLDRSGQKMYQAQEAYMIVHNGKEIALYKPSEMKQAYADAEGLAKKLGGEVHVRKVMREGRAGYNPLTSEKHWHEVERYLSSMINDRTLDPETRAEARQRYLEKRKEAQQKGWAK